MRTPGDDLELAVGLLYTEGVIKSREDLASIAYGADSANVVEVSTVARSGLARSDAPPHPRTSAPPHRPHFMSSACGVCGKTSIEEIRARDLPKVRSAIALEASILITLPDKLRHAQAVFDRTGALHAAALFDTAG